MRKIPTALRDQIAADPYYSRCARVVHGRCDGRITWEHAFVFAGKQINEPWCLLPLCEYHHSVGRDQDGPGLDKQVNLWIALNRADDERLGRFSKAINLKAKRDYLNSIYVDA